MPPFRVKFHCSSVTQHAGGTDHTRVTEIAFDVVRDSELPENPSGHLVLAIAGEAAAFQPGKFYDLDFTPVD